MNELQKLYVRLWFVITIYFVSTALILTSIHHDVRHVQHVLTATTTVKP